MYGPRQKSTNLAGQLAAAAGEVEVPSSFRARVLVNALVEPAAVPRLQRIPMMLSRSQLDEVEPESADFKLRCDLYEGIGFPVGPLEAIYVVLSWGGAERRSTPRSPSEGKVQFESPGVGREGYYEQLDEIGVRLPSQPEQQYDVFVHVYVQSPLGDRRLGFKRYRTKQLLPDNGWSAAPQWVQLSPDPAVRELLSIHGAMLQLSLRYGTEKQVRVAAPRRPHVRIPKLMRYELKANVYQARDLQAADDNGLADPYVRVSLAGATAETAVVERTLQPIWYQSVTLPLELPRDLSLAPKVALVVYDSDAFLGLNLMKEMADPVIGLALAPADPARTIKDFYVPYRPEGAAPAHVPEPEWVDLFDPDVADQLALHATDPLAVPKPPTVGALLVSFELRPEQDAKKAALAQQRREAEEEKAGKRPKASFGSLLGISAGGIALPKLIPCYIEVSLVGVRDMQPRTISGVPVEISAPYVEFEYGHRSASERLWKTRATSASVSNGALSQGPNANFLETLYLQVELPDDPRYNPVMGVRVRDSARLLSFLPGASSWADPMCGVCSVPLGEPAGLKCHPPCLRTALHMPPWTT
jgi:hypothetical protein